MIPRLEAEESLRRAKEIAVGTGSITTARDVLATWERIAGLTAPAARATTRKRPALFSDEVLARLPVRRVKARKG
jgi:hypothetical protein